jgi:hypothetical protein
VEETLLLNWILHVKIVKGTFGNTHYIPDHMGVDHGGFNMFMTAVLFCDFSIPPRGWWKPLALRRSSYCDRVHDPEPPSPLGGKVGMGVIKVLWSTPTLTLPPHRRGRGF